MSVWHTAKAAAGKKPWTDSIELIAGNLVEYECRYEEAGVGHVSKVAIKVESAAPVNTHGVAVEATFIGSDDQEAAERMKDSNVNFHLCRFKPRQGACKVTTDGLLHSEKFRKLSTSSSSTAFGA